MKIECKYCLDQFSVYPSRVGLRKYCSRSCFEKANAGIKKEYVCMGCGVVFDDYLSNRERKYCSKKCQTKNKPSLKGENSPRWNSVMIKCKHCGKDFSKWPSRESKTYCSRKCFSASMSGKYPKNFKGKRGTKPRTYHSRKRDKYGSAFDREWRISVFERDNYTCQECNVRGGRLQAHHIKSYREHPKLRHDISNGLTLCLDCHKKTDTYGWSKYWHKR